MPGAWTKNTRQLAKKSQRVFYFALKSPNNISSHDQVNQPYDDHTVGMSSSNQAKRYSLYLPVSDQLFMGLDVGQTLFVPV